MGIGLVGVGRMGRVLATALAGNVDLCLFDRNRAQMNAIAETLSVSTVDHLEEIVKMGTVILAVPDHEVVSCIKMFNQIQEPITVINIATNVAQHMLEKMAAPHVKCICIKFIGHADEMALGEKPVIIINQFPADLVPQMIEIFQLIGQVLVGKADIVYTINTIAAEKALEAAVNIEELLKQQNITNEIMVKSAIRQVAAGILKAYADENLGPFAREIVQSVKSKINKN
ncbi:NAD(P)-binding domain-containing protein [Pelosinus sp. sgz500959]|uniref:NAD(P)-binding domain-containing protein n=1 Tax=Pelosinus sp. sgz500959 TaxID=3242472 RepID=UPI0036706D6F